jgi:hypothetical protein
MLPRSERVLRSSDVTALRAALVRLGIFIYEYEEMPELLGGCWSLIVRKGDTMVRFFWDGRDDLLTVDEAAYIPSSSEYLWRPTNVPKVDVDETREPLRYIEAVLKKKFYA